MCLHAHTHTHLQKWDHVIGNEKQNNLLLGDSLLQLDISMTRRRIQGLRAGEGRVELQKLPLQISRLDVLSCSNCVCPTHLLATTKGRLPSPSEIWGHLYSECESCFFLWNITFFLLKSNRKHFIMEGWRASTGWKKHSQELKWNMVMKNKTIYWLDKFFSLC